MKGERRTFDVHGQGIMDLDEISRKTGIPYNTLRCRLRRGRSIECAIAMGMPKRDHARMHNYHGSLMTLHEISLASGKSVAAICSAMWRKGCSAEEAVDGIAPHADEWPETVEREEKLARSICRMIYGGTVESNGFRTILPGHAFEFGSKSFLCRVNAEGMRARLTVFCRNTRQVSLRRAIVMGRGGRIEIQKE